MAASRGRRLGVDVGSVRIGVAMSDPGGILATPLVTIRRDEVGWATIGQPPTVRADRAEGDAVAAVTVPADVAELARLVVEHEVVEVVVGLPVTLAGTESYAAIAARAYADVLSAAVAPVPLTLTDERMSTAVAARRLAERGVRRGRRRAVVDQAAAVEILQGWLDAARRRDG
jgi:putative Holliday junction resolvase